MKSKEFLDWVEKAAVENLKGRLATGDMLLAQAGTLLSILLVAIGGALAYAVKLADTASRTPLIWGMAGTTVWLCIVASALMWKCIMTRVTPALYNEPKSFLGVDPAIGFDQLREYELQNMQARIDQAVARNKAVASWLDRCRGGAIATPLAFIVASGFAACLSAA